MCLEVLRQQMPQGTHILQHAPPTKFLQSIFGLHLNGLDLLQCNAGKSEQHVTGGGAVGCPPKTS